MGRVFGHAGFRRRLIVPAILVIAIGLCFAVWYLELGSRVERVAAPHALSVEMGIPSAAGAEQREELAAAWLRERTSDFAAAEARYHVDRRSVAGLIAYEGLVNVHLSEYGGLVRWAGAGKVRYKASPLGEGMPASKEVEELGLLPRRTMSERRALLRDPAWSIKYVAAIMRGLSDVVSRRTKVNVACEPGALATLASAWTLAEADRHFGNVRPGYKIAYNYPGNWVANRLDFLERAVGRPEVSACHSSLRRNSVDH